MFYWFCILSWFWFGFCFGCCVFGFVCGDVFKISFKVFCFGCFSVFFVGSFESFVGFSCGVEVIFVSCFEVIVVWFLDGIDIEVGYLRVWVMEWICLRRGCFGNIILVRVFYYFDFVWLVVI